MNRRNVPVSLRCLWLFILSFIATSAAASRNEPLVTLRSASAVRKAFESTERVDPSTGTLKVPAIVSEKLFARFFAISKTTYPQGDDPIWVKQQFALGRQGVGRYFIFVGDHTLIEKALISGQYNPAEIMAYVGYGAGTVCSNTQNYWLLVFKPKSQPVSATYSHNLQKWLDHVYGVKHSPKINPDVVDSLMNTRFSTLSGCPLDPLSGAFRWSDLDRCLAPFKDTVKGLNQKQCENPNALTYSPSNQCPTDRVLRSFGAKPSAIELRAWLFASNSFSEFFTGNGYSGNFYNTPSNREFWVDNAWLRNLQEIELLKVQCQNKASPNATAITDGLLRSSSPKPFGSLVDEY
jgi:hypothetical protein